MFLLLLGLGRGLPCQWAIRKLTRVTNKQCKAASAGSMVAPRASNGLDQLVIDYRITCSTNRSCGPAGAVHILLWCACSWRGIGPEFSDVVRVSPMKSSLGAITFFRAGPGIRCDKPASPTESRFANRLNESFATHSRQVQTIIRSLYLIEMGRSRLPIGANSDSVCMG